MIDNDDNYPYGDDKNVPPPRTSQQSEAFYGYRDEPVAAKAGRRRRRVSIRTILALVALIMVVVIWMVYPDGETNYDDAELPLVRADNTPYKTAPESRGGEEIPFQDSTIFEAMEETYNRGNDDGVELLLPEEGTSGERAKVITGSEDSLVQEPNMNLDTKLSETAKVVTVPKDMPAAEQPKSEEPVVAKPAETTTTSAPAAGDYYIQLGAFRTQTDAEAAYTKAVEKYGSILAGADVKYERADLGDKGIYYRVKVGPMAQDDAKSRCTKIQDIQSGGCFVAR